MKITPTEDQKKMLAYLLAGGLSLSAAVSGVFLTAPSEGMKTTPYLDPVGIATTCLGHTGPDVKMGKQYTVSECLDLFAEDLGEAEEDVDAVIKVPLNTYQKAALIDFAFNYGRTKFRNSTMADLFNQGRYTEGCRQLVNWVYAGKKKLPGLEIRRDKELQFCLGTLEIENV